jgi:transcriptional regulator with XRE-family HTH domain
VNAALLALLAEARREAGISIEALGKLARLDRTYVGLLEQRKRQPTVVVALDLAEALGLSLGDLLRRAKRIASLKDKDAEGMEVGLSSASTRRVARRDCVESDDELRKATGLAAEAVLSAIDDAYHMLDMLDRRLAEDDLPGRHGARRISPSCSVPVCRVIISRAAIPQTGAQDTIERKGSCAVRNVALELI